jgi:hypothetical protein
MSDSTGPSPPSADTSPLSFEDFSELIPYIDRLLGLGKRLSAAPTAQDCKEYLISEASLAFIKTMLSLQGFLRFIPASQFHAKEETDFVIDLSSASAMARQFLEDAISFFYLSQSPLTKEEKRFRQIVWRYHGSMEIITCAEYLAELMSLHKALATDERDTAQKEFKRLLEEPAFLAMLNSIPKLRKNIMKGLERYVLRKDEIVDLRGIRKEAFQLPYKLFSNFAHTSSCSLALMRQTTTQHPERWQKFLIASAFVTGFAAEVIEAFLETFSETRKLVDDEERTIISSFRSFLLR